MAFHEHPKEDRAERERRSRIILAQIVQEAGALLVRLERNPGKLDVDGRDAASLGEYVAMFDDAIAGRERGTRTAKIRKTLIYTVPR